MTFPLDTRAGEKLLTGWGRVARSRSMVVDVSDAEGITEAVKDSGPRGLIARGLGRSYGDAAQDAGGMALDLHALNSIAIDGDVATVGAGVSLDALLTACVPLGYFVPVTPGTRQVSIGGAIAADVHGKNHHRDGSFASHVLDVTVIDGLGQCRVLSPEDPLTTNEFWATCGGMGLTGVIVEARVRLIPVETSSIVVDTQRAGDLDEVMDALTGFDKTSRYTVAWIDTLARGAAFGRGVVSAGDHAALDDLSAKARSNPLHWKAEPKVTAPSLVPSGLLNRWTVRAFNQAWFHKAPVKARTVEEATTFFHPLDAVRDWNRLYGPGGFVQYQFVVPDAHAHIVSAVLGALQRIGAPSFLTVLKRFGAGDKGYLSFPKRGWTLACDLPAGIPGLADTLDRCDELVVGAGGRVYLAKDSRLKREFIPTMYPRIEEWRAVRSSMDPQRVFMSDLARRLDL